MENSHSERKFKGGRKPKISPATHRYTVNFTAEENAQFLSQFERSGMKVYAQYISACIFQRQVKIVTVDKSAIDFHQELTRLFAQFRSIGINYNQVVKILYRNFSEKKAGAYLFKLEKQTAEFARICKEVIAMTEDFKSRYLENQHENTSKP